MHLFTGAMSSNQGNRFARLTSTIEDFRDRPFLLGTSDCAIFAGAVVLALTEIDLYKKYSGLYDNEFSLLRLLKKNGCNDVVELCAREFAKVGIKEVHIHYANRGDIVSFLDTQDVACLGVCVGSKCLFHAERGLAAIDRSKCTRAWALTDG